MSKKILTACAVLLMAATVLPVLTSAKTLGQLDEQAVREYQNVKTQYVNQKNQWLTAKQTFLNARAKWQANKDKPNSADLLTAAKSYLISGIDVLVKYIDVMKAKINASWLSDEDKATMLKELDSDRAWLLNQKSAIQAATTREELTSLLNTSRARWDKVKAEGKRYGGLALVARAEYVHGRLVSAIASVKVKIEAGKQQGLDVSAAVAQINDAEAKLALAVAEYQSARQTYLSINSITDANAKAVSGNAKVNKANVYIKAAHANLKNITLTIKPNATTTPPVATTTP